MALRNLKITSEIIQSCNRLFSSKPDISAKTKLPETICYERDLTENRQPLRYKISNTERPSDLPEINFKKDEDITMFSDLQPSAKPQFNFDNTAAKWADDNNNCPFPQSIKPLKCTPMTMSDQQKAEDKILKVKSYNFSPVSRHYSTHKKHHKSGGSKDGHHNEKECGKGLRKECHPKCPPRKKKCDKGPCPTFALENCEQTKVKDCKHYYIDPHCKKTFAPYPSYSELCAPEFPDNPSECEQCPWRTCDGPDTIFPQKKKNKRHYSTSTNGRHIMATTGVVTEPNPPGAVFASASGVGELICDARKPACQEPPSPCEIRRKHEQKHKKDHKKKKDHHKKHKKGCLELEEGASEVLFNPYTLEPLEPLEMEMEASDLVDGLMLKGGKKKHPNCHKPVKRVPQPKSKEQLELKKKDKPAKGDEGHPPPCDTPAERSKNCPKKPMKKPKYKRRPLRESFYRKPEEPYNKNSPDK